jgi:hypothetical protein
MDILKNKTSYDEDYILKLLEAWASEVPQGIPNTKEIADAIRAGGIELEWR